MPMLSRPTSAHVARRLIPLFAATAMLSACASSGASGGGAVGSSAPTTQTVGGAAVGRVAVTTTNEAYISTVPFTADAVFRVLPSVFDSLGITVNTIDPARRQIGNNGFKIRQKLGKAILSTLLDCGASQIGPNADSYDVYLIVMTTVTPSGTDAAQIATLVDAQARPLTFNQGYNRCTTKGNLEQKLADLVTRRLSK